MKKSELLKVMKNAIKMGEIGKKKLIENAKKSGIIFKKGGLIKITDKLVFHPEMKILGYFKENGEFVQVVDKTEGGKRK